ncbi:hypothetical protein WMF20_50080 [Sorangium sp. So ce834]|uniref:hypothetical protein n=1 Tax=Sorangium sp. So ce834 TaxID=3133321 RepID=UPI003F5E28E5
MVHAALPNLRGLDTFAVWCRGILWLSLDRFERFWPDLGLSFPDAEGAKAAARAALLEKRALDAADNDDLDYSGRLDVVADTLVRTIAETCGPTSAARFVAWVRGPVVASAKEPLWHDTWSTLLYRMPTHDPALIASGYGIPYETMERLFEIAKRYVAEHDALDMRVEAADEEPLSGWDADAYADYRIDSGPVLSPLDGLRAHLYFLRFDDAWSEILRITRPQDIDALVRWGRAYLALRGRIPLDAAHIPDHARSLS